MLRKVSFDIEYQDILGYQDPFFFEQSPVYFQEQYNNEESQPVYLDVVAPVPCKVEKRNYTPEEDELIIKLVGQYGRRWKQIATHFQGRNQRMIRNRYLRIQGKQRSPTQSNNNLRKKIQCNEQSHTSSFTVQQSNVNTQLNCIAEIQNQIQSIQQLLKSTKEDVFNLIISKNFLNFPPNADKAFQAEMVQKYIDKQHN